MPAAKLILALKSVDWNGNVSKFVSDTAMLSQFANANLRTAVWAKQFEISDSGNPALAFVRSMQSAGQLVPVLAALAIYDAAAASMRALLENALHYTYFRSHPVELATLVRDTGYFVDKRSLVEFHKLHTKGFQEAQQALGLLSRLDAFYSKISAIIHCQIPGAWMSQKAVSEIAPNQKMLHNVLGAFLEAEEIVHRLFLCTVGKELWDAFSTTAKKKLLTGLPGPQKIALGLDAA
jgi:hypothetical protein